MNVEPPASMLSQGDTILQVASTECWEGQKQTEEQNEDSLRFPGKRAARLRQQNDSMASTRVLLTEILSLIFSYACGDPVSDPTCQRDLVRLGHICSEWRDIILSIPQLWSRFTLSIDAQSDRHQSLQLLLLYLNNSGNSPFCLCISFPRLYHACFGLTGQIFYTLQQYVPKLHTLRIECVPWAWVPWLSWLSSVENLEISSVAVPDGPNVILSFVKFTRLQRLELSGSPSLRGAQLPWEQITSLRLRSMPIDLCMSLLIQCPNLVKFHATSSRRRTEGHAPIPQLFGHALRLENLQYLSWSYEPDSTCNPFYHQLRFPSLHTLHWHSPSYRKAPSITGELNVLRSLALNFPPTISQLHLSQVGSWSNDLMELLFDNTKNLKVIHFLNCKYSMIVNCMSLLNRTSACGRYTSPSVTEIVIQNPYAQAPNLASKGQSEAELASCIVSAIHGRDPSKTRQFSLQLVQTGGLASEEMRQAYISLKKDGYAFDIWMDATRVNSFQSVIDDERRVQSKEGVLLVDSQFLPAVDSEDEMNV